MKTLKIMHDVSHLFIQLYGMWQHSPRQTCHTDCDFNSPDAVYFTKLSNVSVQAQESYEKAMEKARKEHERSNVSPAIFPEYQLWEDHWIR